MATIIDPFKKSDSAINIIDPFKADTPKPAEEKSGVIRRAFGDTGLSLLKGAIAVPEVAVGLADAVSGGRAGKTAEELGFRAKDAKGIIDEFYSPEAKLAQEKFQQADGVIDKTLTAVQNPSLITNALAESAPLIGAGGVIGRGVTALAPNVSGVVAGAVGEGVTGAGLALEGTRQETADGLLTPEQVALGATSGALTGAISVGAGKVANRLGIDDVDTMVVDGVQQEVTKSAPRRILEGAFSEGILEELPQSLQEQALQNLALDRDVTEGLVDAGVLGALSGGVMGGAINALPRRKIEALNQDGSVTELNEEGGTLERAAIAGVESGATAGTISTESLANDELLNRIEANNVSDINTDANVVAGIDQPTSDNPSGSIIDPFQGNGSNGVGQGNVDNPDGTGNANEQNTSVRDATTTPDQPIEPPKTNTAIQQAAQQAATSPLNNLNEPTDAQKDAGNYKLGKVKLSGLDISIENPQGSVRSSRKDDPNEWQNTMTDHYGYIKGVKAKSPDKEKVDVYINPKTPDNFEGDVFVVNQIDPKTGKFDETKSMIGYNTLEEAEAAYRRNYADDWQGLESITPVPMARFKEMLNDENAFMQPVKPLQPSKTTNFADAKEGDIIETGGVQYRKVGNGFERIVTPEATVTTTSDLTGDLPSTTTGEPTATLPTTPTADTPTKFTSKKQVADAFKAQTGRDIESAGTVLAGIAMRNIQRDNGNLTSPREESPFTPEQMAMLEQYKGFSKKSPNLFHTTKAENVLSIAEQGLINNAPRRQEGVSGEGKISLAANEEMAKVYGSPEDVMLRVNKDYKFDDLETDNLAGGEGTYTTAKNIPPEALEIKDGNKWKPLKEYAQAKKAEAEDSDARLIIEGITKRRNVANQLGKIKAFDGALAIAKKLLNGETVKPSQFNLAIKAFKNDEALASAFTKLQNIAKLPAKQAKAEKANAIDSYKQRITEAKNEAELNAIAKEVQADTALNDDQAAMLDDLVFDAMDSLTADTQEADQVDDADAPADAVTPETTAPQAEPEATIANEAAPEVDAKKITAFKRDIERSLFNAAMLFELGDANNFIAFTSANADKLKQAAMEMRKDATPEQAKAFDLVLKDDKLNLSANFWKNVFKELQTKAGIDTSRKSKLENTGITLRRWFEKNQEEVAKAQDWKAIDKVTARAKVFMPEIPEDADSNLQAYIDIVRGAKISTFTDYVDTYSRFRTYGRVSKGIVNRIQNYLNGDSYISSRGQGESKEDRIAYMRQLANEYLTLIDKLNKGLSGAKTADEFSQKFKDTLESVHFDTLPDWITVKELEGRFVYEANEATAPEQFKKFKTYEYGDDFVKANTNALNRLNTDATDAEFGDVLSGKTANRYWYPDGNYHAMAKVKAGKPNAGKNLVLTRPRLDRITRVGRKDYRDGKDVTPQQVKDTFGFADVMFGKYVNAVQDQKHLNYAYDAFSDMAEITGLPKTAMGLGGKLYLAIGALGHGKAAAHYADNQPKEEGGTVHVINITNTRGDGTVAHEWTHALDYHLMHYDQAGYRQALKLVRRDLSTDYNLDRVKREAQRFFGGIVYYPHLRKNGKGILDQAIYHIRDNRGGQADTTKYQREANELGKDYWGNEREILARAGEAYIYDQLADAKTTSDYLVTDWVADGKTTKDSGYRGTPYPEGEERKRFNANFKALFASLEATKDGVKVNLDTFKQLYKDPKEAFDEGKAEIIENMPRYFEDWKAERQASREKRETIDAETQKLIDEQKRIAEQAEQAQIEQAVNDALDPNKQTGSLSDEVLSAIFDEAAAELTEAATEQPDVVVGEPTVSTPPANEEEGMERAKAFAERMKQKREAKKAGVTPEEQMQAKDLALKAAKLGVKGIDEALTGLVNLFGGTNRLNSFPSGFDEDAYRKAKPHFEASLTAFIEAGKTLKDLFKFLIENFGIGIKPYAIQFAKDKSLGAQLSDQPQGSRNEPIESDNDGEGRDEGARPDPVQGSGSGESVGTDSGIESQRDDGADRGNDASVDGTESQPDTASTGNGESASDRASDSQLDKIPTNKRNNRLAKNFVIPQGGLTRQGSWKESANRNFDAIEIVNKLEEEQRQATPEEQEALSKYVGFGASEIRNNLFPTNAFSGGIYRFGWVRSDWKLEAEKASRLLTPDELKSMVRSTQYAHYTPESMVRGIWKGLSRMGFTGGNVLEAGMGSGNFTGTMPADIAKASKYTGIEYDKTTAKIAKYLYPESNVIQADFTELKLPNGFFDLTVGNPPFAETRITNDPAYKKMGFYIHDYFIAKSLDKVRDGGLAVFVTSKGTMDKLNDRARKFIAERADLIAAIRMPQTAFKENAGTETVTDVLVLRKRAKDTPAGGAQWQNMKEIKLTSDNGMTDTRLINEYFVDNPSMVLGENALEWGRFGWDYTVKAKPDTNIEEAFNKAIDTLPQNVYSPAQSNPAVIKTVAAERDFNPTNKKEGGLYVDDKGKLMVVDNGSGVSAMESLGLNDKTEQYLKDYVKLRDALKQARYDQWNDNDWEASLKALNKTYDAFVKKHGYIKDFTSSFVTETDDDGVESKVERRRFKNWKVIKNDVEGTWVWALENVDERGNITKSKSLTDRTIKKPEPAKIETIQDALAVVLDANGSLDLEQVAQLSGKTKDAVIAELGDLVFENPSGAWQMRDEYLSGKVIDKLEEAEAAAKVDKRYERNVKALLAVQPKPLSADNISVGLGSNWIPANVMESFVDEVMGENFSITYNETLNAWKVEGNGSRKYQRGRTSDFGTSDRSPAELLEQVMNSKTLEVKRTDENKKTYTDTDATAQINEIAKKMRMRFTTWIWTDAKRAEMLIAMYNRKFNDIVGREFDGSHLTLAGVSLKYSIHPHQRRVIWRIVQTGNTYINHAVGAGKTIEMIASAMEQRRLGMIRRPMFVVPNHMLEQFASEFVDLYPAANIMVADKENFHTDTRRKFVAQAAMNDPDAIIITHSAFGRIGLTPDNYDNIVQEQIDELQIKLEDVKADGDRTSVKKMQQQIEALEKKLKGKIDADKKDVAVTFEDIGVDMLYVDEAHEFRKLDFATNRTKVKGIDPNGSSKSLDLYTKIRYLSSINPTRSHVFASGTPVTNTMGELYTVMKFFAKQELEDTGLADFDAWATMFGEVASDFERNAAGNYELVERFANFVNIPELMKRVRSFMDVLTSSDLGTLVKRPTIVGGGRKIVVTPMPQTLKNYMDTELTPRIATSKAWKPSKDQPNNPDPIIAIIGDARFANIDMRFVDPTLPNDPDSKLNKMIDGIIEVHNRIKDKEFIDGKTGKPEPLTGATQIVFANVGFGEQAAKNRGFSAKDWMNKRLKEAGIKPSEIAWMMDYDTSLKKETMFMQMRSGEKRILIGSPKNMGTGVNVQSRLAALHYLDSPWFPSDLEQPEGRIYRQGNKNEMIELYAYATKGSYDSSMWQAVARKGRFIEQAFNGDDSVRRLEDVSEAGSYAMAAALASGDDRVVRLAGLEADVEKFNRLKNAHFQQQRELRTKSVVNEATIREIKERIANLTEAEKVVGTGLYGDTEFVVGGKSYKDKAEAGKAIIDAYEKLGGTFKKAGDKADFAKVAGKFGVSIEVSRDAGQFIIPRLMVRVTDKLNFTVDEGKSLLDKDPSGLATRLVNQINRVSRMKSDAETALEQSNREKANIESKVGAPFEYEQEMLEKVAEAARLREELSSTGNDADAELQAVSAETPAAEDDNTWAIAINNGVNSEKVVKATLVDTWRLVDADKRFSEYKFFKHYDETQDKWVVSESETGRRVKSDSFDSVEKVAIDTLISAGFDRFKELVDRSPTVQFVPKKWADYESVSFSNNAGTTTPLLIDDIKKAIKSSTFGVDVDVYASMMDAPVYVQLQALSEGAMGVEGFYDRTTNRVAIIASNLSSVERAVEVTRHELIGHYGMENMLGKNLMDRLINQVIKAEKVNKTMQEIGAYVDDTQPNISQERRAKEIIAVMAERNLQNGIVRQFMDAVRRFLKKIGLYKGDVTDAQIAELLREAQNYLKAKGRTFTEPAMQASFSNATQINSPAFKKWFGDSKVVHRNGEPMIVYHGTEVGGFTVFNTNGKGKTEGTGAFFTETRTGAASYSWAKGDVPLGGTNQTPGVYPVYLSLQNPLVIDAKDRYWDDVNGETTDDIVREARKSGKYDGVIFENITDEGPYGEGFGWDNKTFVVFSPSQIKSAIGNNGNFDPNNNSILFSNNPQARLNQQWEIPKESKLGENLIYALQDKNIDLKRVTESIKSTNGEITDRWDAYLQEELYHGRSAKRTQDFLKNELEPLIKSMQDMNVKMADFEEYLWMRHAEERNIQIAKVNPEMPDGGSGVSTEEAQAYLDGLSPELKNKYQRLAKRIDNINARTTQLLVDYGLESQSTIDQWNGAYKNYVPLMREEMDAASGMGTGQGFSVKGNSSKRATGSSRAVVDILANIALQRERNIIRGEKNRVSTALIGLATLNPNEEFWQTNKVPSIKQIGKDGLVEERPDPTYKNKDNVIVARIPNKQGEIIEQFVMFNQFNQRAMRMSASLKNLDQDQIGEFQSAASTVTRYFASINTQYNPIFGVINILRDVQGAMLNLSSTQLAGKQKEVIKHTLPALKGIYKDIRNARDGVASGGYWAQLFEEFQNEGGQTGYRDMFRNAKERGEAIEQALDPAYWQKTKLGKIFSLNGRIAAPQQAILDKVGKPIFEWLSDYNQTLENAVRLSAYKVAIDSGMSKQQAASVAKNLTVNFNRKGEMGREIGAFYAFFNASVQGTARLYDTLKGKAGKRIIYGGILIGVMQALALAEAGFDDDEPPEFVRDRNIIIPLGDGKFMTIPMPLGFNVLPAIGRIMAEYALSGFKDPAKRATHLVEVFMDMFNPIGNAGMSMQTLTPTALDPLTAIAENKDFAGRSIAKADFNSLEPTAGFTRAKDTATGIGKAISYGLNFLTGGTEDTAGAVSPTPDQIDYLIGQVFGGVGREYQKIEQSVTSAYTGEDLPSYKVPLFGRFIGNANESASVRNAFYNNVRTMNEFENRIKGMRERGEDVAGFIADNPEARLILPTKNVYNRINKLRETRKKILDQQGRNEDVSKIESTMTQLMQSLNDKIKQTANEQ